MLGKLTQTLSKIFGTKYDRDIKSYLPMVDRIHEEEEHLLNMTHDELRNVSLQLKERFKDYLSDFD